MCRWRPQWLSPPPSRPWYPPWASKVVTLLSQPPLPIALTPPWPRPLLVACSLPPFNFSSASYRPTWRVPHHFLLSQSLSAPAWPACFTHFVLLDWMVVMVVRLSVIIATFFLCFLACLVQGWCFVIGAPLCCGFASNHQLVLFFVFLANAVLIYWQVRYADAFWFSVVSWKF